MQTPKEFQLNFQAGELRRNLPILLKTDCSGTASIVSIDGENRYDTLEFVPLRLDYTTDAYEGKPLGLLLCVAVSGEQIRVKNSKDRRQIPAGLNFYLMLKSSRTMQGSLDNFISMRTAVEQMMNIRSCGLVWMASFEIKTGNIVDENGQKKSVKYSRCHWLVREVENDDEQNLLNQLAQEYSQSEFFEGICPVQNEIIAQFDAASKESQLKRLETSEQKALPEA